ncbi:MAG: hypothetical protein FJ006_11610 [Chloroflexi bacterium]|nr:hypothetical protein [Chloroflexota bacterium]
MTAITNVGALSSYLNKPKSIKLDDTCTLYVKQLKVSEFNALREKCEKLEQNKDEQDVSASVDIICSLITDEKGNLLFNSEQAIQELKDNLTLDFVRKFFDKFWESFSFTSKELAQAETTFRQ